MDTVTADDFKGNVNLSSIRIPEGITKILEGAFEGCSDLSSVIIPASAKVIEKNAFVGCNSLETITLAESIVQIEYWLSPGVKCFVAKEELVSVLKKGQEVRLLCEEDIDHFA